MDIDIEVPNDINSITLGDYQRYMKIVQANEDAEGEFLDIKLLEIFCNVPYVDIHKMPIASFEEVLMHFSDIFSAKTPLVRRFSLKDSEEKEYEFGFIPNLGEMTTGEYIDLNNYFEDIDNLHKVMAVLFRPVHKSWKGKEAYRIAEYQGTTEMAEIMKSMPLGIALGARVFFYRLGMKLSKHTLTYSLKHLSETTTLSEEEKQTLLKNTDGINNFMLLQEEMLSKLTQQPFSQYTKP